MTSLKVCTIVQETTRRQVLHLDLRGRELLPNLNLLVKIVYLMTSSLLYSENSDPVFFVKPERENRVNETPFGRLHNTPMISQGYSLQVYRSLTLKDGRRYMDGNLHLDSLLVSGLVVKLSEKLIIDSFSVGRFAEGLKTRYI